MKVKSKDDKKNKKGKGNLEALDKYWKQRMPKGKLGTFTSAVTTLDRPGITNPKALAAWWHKRETGETPMQKHARKKKGKKMKRKLKAK